MYIAILSKSGKQLMPTKRAGKVRHLLKLGKAKIVCYNPFTIQLLYDSKEFTQEIIAGVDLGSKHLAISLTTEKQEVYVTQVELRTDITKLLSSRSQLRRSRRSRKLRRRKPRFLNRANARKEGRLMPSVQHKVDSTIKILNNINKYFPVSKFIIEKAPFDIQKINNPNIKGIEYQQGNQLGFLNVREYVLYRDGHECRSCGKKSGILHVHHIESRQTGGEAPNNLVILCDKCHEKHHTNKKPLKFNRGKSFKDAIQVTIISKRIIDWLNQNNINYQTTYGYITKYTRNQLGLEKSHINDAFVISGIFNVKRLNYYMLQKFVRKNNRQLHLPKPSKGGIRRSIRCPKYVFGYQMYDKVRYNNEICFIYTRRTDGSFMIKKLDGTIISKGKDYKKMKLVQKAKTLIYERKFR